MAAIDENTGQLVWRKVVGRSSRMAPETLEITLEDAAGKREVIEATPEHPFHIEGWDGSTGAMMSALETNTANDNGRVASDAAQSTMTGPRLFPSRGKTPFGEWVKAGALKEGDQVSTAESVASQASAAPTAANDNAPLVVSDILLSDHLTRVYNLEIESWSGEETHNYLVGNNKAWVHNIHGNSRNSSRRAYLYKLVCNGVFMKWGISQNPAGRYTKKFLQKFGCGDPIIIDSGPRCDIRDMEMDLNRHRPGPWNRRI